jgi:hypothetical protein
VIPIPIAEDIALRPSGRMYVSLGVTAAPSALPRPTYYYLTSCSGRLTNTNFDSQNCGSCGTRCSTTERCCDGHCTPIQNNCGGCGASFSCDSAELCCPGEDGEYRCVDPGTDPDHCGGCDIPPCDFSPPAGGFHQYSRCCEFGRCLDTEDFKINPSHCGTCENDCAVTCGPECNCSDGHCCPKCTAWFDGIQGSDWGTYGGIAGTLLGGFFGAGLGKLLGDLFSDAVKPGCYSCDEIKRWTNVNLACCNGVCTDLDSDRLNCAACGKNCSSPIYNKVCVKGRCVCPPERPDECHFECINLKTSQYCGTCGNICYPDSCCIYNAQVGYDNCARVFFDEDPSNCGFCGHNCPAGWSCCSGKCINIYDDRKNCGTCGMSCPPGEVCCDGFCTNTRTDSDNCGSCDYACILHFDDGRTDCCNRSCVNKQSDVANCGTCGHKCRAGEVCVQGACVEDTPIM